MHLKMKVEMNFKTHFRLNDILLFDRADETRVNCSGKFSPIQVEFVNFRGKLGVEHRRILARRWRRMSEVRPGLQQWLGLEFQTGLLGRDLGSGSRVGYRQACWGGSGNDGDFSAWGSGSVDLFLDLDFAQVTWYDLADLNWID
ncbi:unnamed protein product [Cuscuta campestris]|uniref:Uncharacterized protein n=1 Tax=Cuscuta campestris TaxID=132261 RepID=A0A484MHK1_9ASTE|nr:unnamed protein product [Cuscuta campestris]